jgi:hypothetical protein
MTIEQHQAKPDIPPGIDAAIKDVEDAHKALRAAAMWLTAATANLQAMVEIEKARQP